MTALPLERLRQLAVAEFADGRYELQEGKVVVSPSPVPEHQLYQQELQVRPLGQVPVHLKVVPVSGVFTAEQPFPVRLDLDRLG